mmetsp:Transcript_1511/g.3220  ORF Transcript_1511/g.3220 Transcript_1511/m.3220 type:complete len:220 (-) Transcript_1511:425-1084(-)
MTRNANDRWMLRQEGRFPRRRSWGTVFRFFVKLLQHGAFSRRGQFEQVRKFGLIKVSGRRSITAEYHPFDSIFMHLFLVHLLLHCTRSYETIHLNILSLANSVTPIDRLRVFRRVPRRVINNRTISPRQGQTRARRLRREKHDIDFARAIIEVIDVLLARILGRRTVDSQEAYGTIHHDLLYDIQHFGALGEDECAVPRPSQAVEQCEEYLQFRTVLYQ